MHRTLYMYIQVRPRIARFRPISVPVRPTIGLGPTTGRGPVWLTRYGTGSLISSRIIPPVV